MRSLLPAMPRRARMSGHRRKAAASRSKRRPSTRDNSGTGTSRVVPRPVDAARNNSSVYLQDTGLQTPKKVMKRILVLNTISVKYWNLIGTKSVLMKEFVSKLNLVAETAVVPWSLDYIGVYITITYIKAIQCVHTYSNRCSLKSGNYKYL